MINLEEYYNKKCEQISESEDKFEINYNDSGIMKLIKHFLNWFSGSSEKKAYDPYDKEYNQDGTEAKLKELKDEGIVAKNLKIKEIGEFSNAIAAINNNEGQAYPIFYKYIKDKNEQKRYKNCSFAYICCDIKGICAKKPIILFAFVIDKSMFKIELIEIVSKFEESIKAKEIYNLIREFVIKKAKELDTEIKNISIRVARTSVKKDADFSFNDLLKFMGNTSKFERDGNHEADNDTDRIYVISI